MKRSGRMLLIREAVAGSIGVVSHSGRAQVSARVLQAAGYGTYAFDNAGADTGDEPFETLGPHRRQHQRRAILGGRQQCGALFQACLQRLQRPAELHQQPLELAGLRSGLLTGELLGFNGRPDGSRHGGGRLSQVDDGDDGRLLAKLYGVWRLMCTCMSDLGCCRLTTGAGLRRRTHAGLHVCTRNCLHTYLCIFAASLPLTDPSAPLLIAAMRR